MLKQVVRYPVVRSEIHTFSFEGRTTQWEQDNVFIGPFTDRVMVGLLHLHAFNEGLERFGHQKSEISHGVCRCQRYRVMGLSRR